MKERPYDPWVMCDSCNDVHRESERPMELYDPKRKGFWISCCPKCSEYLQAPQIEVPLQRTFEFKRI